MCAGPAGTKGPGSVASELLSSPCGVATQPGAAPAPQGAAPTPCL